MFTKKKVKNRSQHSQVKTIDSTHSARVNEFAKTEKDVLLLEKKRTKVLSLIETLNTKVRSKLSNEEFDQLFEAERTLEEYDKKLHKLRN